MKLQKYPNDSALVEAEQLLLENRYLKAAKKAQPITRQNLANKKQACKALWIQLYAYNRMQWLVDAFNVVEKMMNLQPLLTADEFQELGLFYVLLGKPEQARKYFKQAITKSGDRTLLFSELAISFEQQGDSRKALDIYDKIIIRTIKTGRVGDTELRVFSRVTGLRTLSKEELNFLIQSYENNIKFELATRLAFVIAKAFRKVSDEKEVEWLIIANKRAAEEEQKAGNNWSVKAAAEKTLQLKQTFNKPKLEWLEIIRKNKEKFVFILGMPRSGTTLLEQIIGAHSEVGNSGESRALGVALFKVGQLPVSLRGYEERDILKSISKWSAPQFKAIANSYKEYQQLFSNKLFVTDKELSNANWVGLIAHLFPEAKFIYIKRDPLDNCVSLMQQNFKGAPYSNCPVSCIQEHADYDCKIQHWIGLYPERCYSLSYESLVDNPRQYIKELMNHLGLEWQEQQINFHERKNSVRTPSVGQVRNAISSVQVGKWAKYKKLIQPAIDLVSN